MASKRGPEGSLGEKNDENSETSKRHARDWSVDMDANDELLAEERAFYESLERDSSMNLDTAEKTVASSSSKTNDDGFKTVESKAAKRRRRSRKGKNKEADKPSVEDKVTRQKRSYIVSDSDLEVYLKRRRVSDKMFSHYLSKRIGFECSRKKRRLNKKEIKALFPSVRTLCFEILSQVRVKKKFNQEKKKALENISKASGMSVLWADIVKGRKTPLSMNENVVLTAKDTKIRNQSDKIKSLQHELEKKDRELQQLRASVANLVDRINVLENNEKTRKQKDVFADKKRLAAKGTPLCNECLPPSSFIYKKPLSTMTANKCNAEVKVKCASCKKTDIHLSKVGAVPLSSWRNADRKFFLYPEGSLHLERIKSEINTTFKTAVFTAYGNQLPVYVTLKTQLINTHGIDLEDGSVANFEKFSNVFLADFLKNNTDIVLINLFKRNGLLSCLDLRPSNFTSVLQQ